MKFYDNSGARTKQNGRVLAALPFWFVRVAGLEVGAVVNKSRECIPPCEHV